MDLSGRGGLFFLYLMYLLTLFNPGNQADPSQLNIEFFAYLLIFAIRR